MADVLAPYSHRHFESLSSLNTARDTFYEMNGDKLVENLFKNLFVRNGVDRTFGLALMHRHFHILPEQRMVDYNGTFAAWNNKPGNGMDEPQPVIWSFSTS